MTWRERLRNVWRRLRHLPAAALATIALVLLTGLVVASYYGYRTYNFVQHDNDFCLSCHLMKDPYEKFAMSAHRDLGCKACHRPTPIARSKMALTQILESPDEIKTHAEVPNATCEECHVEGDPEKWRVIAASAGHRVHFESKDTALQGLKCVECHSTTLHEFAAADKTCSQSGCHEQTEIRLGKMSDLSLHCAVCHEFNRPVADTVGTDSVGLALRPGKPECLSCHAMRRLVENNPMPEDDPHEGMCASCHNPHKQTQPADAGQRCVDCHTRADTLSFVHKGLGPGVLEQCTTCHKAHEFKAEGKTCLDCHQDLAAAAPQQRLVGRDTAQFTHTRHRQVQCEACHDTKNSHGAVKVTSARDCQSCHHTGSVAGRCEACHQPREYIDAPRPRRETMRMTVGASVRTRTLTFTHREHEKTACTRCHAEGLERPATAATCATCHADHHAPTANCRSCHVATPARVHPARVHVTCSGSGCHTSLPAPIRGVPRTREFCLVCHQDLVRHKPEKNCADCHALPRPRAAAGGSPFLHAGL